MASRQSGHRQRKRFVVRQRFMAGAEDENGHADEVEHHGGHVHHVVGPIAPAGKKTVEIAEDFLGPKVDAAFAGIAMCQFNNGDALGPEEKHERNNPQPDGDPAVCGDGRQDVEIEDGDNEKEHEVALSEHALEMRELLGRGSGWDLGCQTTRLLGRGSGPTQKAGPTIAGCL